jgi:predicted nucleotidyltransferase
MPRIEPRLIPLLTDLERGLRELEIPFGIVGALVPELLLNVRPLRMTNDVDVTVVVESLTDFEALKDRLGSYGFERTRTPHRMRHVRGGLLDLLPFSEAITPGGRLRLEEGFDFNMAGFGKVVPHAVATLIDGGLTLPLAPLPLYVLLKLVAFDDRSAPKDLSGTLHCLRNYLGNDERRYGVECGGESVPFEYTSAYLLGVDARIFLDASLDLAVTRVLDLFGDPDSEVIGTLAREDGRPPNEESYRTVTFEFFHWFRLGTGL